MRTRHLLIALAIAGASAPPTLSAQGTARLGMIPVTPPLPDPAHVNAQLAIADSLAYAGKSDDARTRYRLLVEEMRAAGQYPREALWHLANSYLESDESQRVADIMDELAVSAAKFGDPTTELNATFESAVIYQQLRQPSRSATRLGRAKELLQSPAISESAKHQVEARMGASN